MTFGLYQGILYKNEDKYGWQNREDKVLKDCAKDRKAYILRAPVKAKEGKDWQ